MYLQVYLIQHYYITENQNPQSNKAGKQSLFEELHSTTAGEENYKMLFNYWHYTDVSRTMESWPV